MENDLMKSDAEMEMIPGITERVGERLPRFFREIAEMGKSGEESDMLLLGALATISSALPKIQGMYGGSIVFPNLFFFLNAPASAGKGKLSLCKSLVMPIHAVKREERKRMIRNIIDELEAQGKKVAQTDVNIAQKMLLIPGDSTATAIYQGLGDNEGAGLIFETEADTLANSLNGEFSFSDGLRKAFHHETISYFRRKENEMVEIMKPKLSLVLAGTPKQFVRLVKGTEDGLFSRFMIMRLKRTLVWNNVFEKAAEGKSFEEMFDELGSRYLQFYMALEQMEGCVEFVLTEEQMAKFNTYFEQAQSLMANVYGDDIVASVRRMGLVVFRIAMILSAVRLMDCGMQFAGDCVPCSDVDFDSAMWIGEVLMKHTLLVFGEMPEGAEAGRLVDVKLMHSERMLEKLPEVFARVQAVKVGEEMGLSVPSVDKYLKFMREVGMVTLVKRGYFRKNAAEDEKKSA